jgi:hypothetical protein
VTPAGQPQWKTGLTEASYKNQTETLPADS